MIFALVMVFLWCYIPQLQVVLGTAQVPVEHFFLPVAFGLFLLLMDEARKWAIRSFPQGFMAKTAW